MQAEVNRLEDENKAMLEEKTSWLSRLQADNRKLGLMFHDINETKRRLVREIDGVQTEKARLSSLSMAVHEDEIEKLVGGSMLSPSARKLLPLDKRAVAAEVYERLTQLVTQCRENQSEVLQAVRDKVQQVESGFRAGTPEGAEKMEAALDALKNMASTLPGNLLAAEAVAASLSEAMVCALLDKSSAILSRKEAAMAGDFLQEAFGGEGGGAWGGAGLPAMTVELKKVKAENDSLKRKILEMKKMHNAQLVKHAEATKAATAKAAAALPLPLSPKGGGGASQKAGAALICSLDTVRVAIDMDRDFNDLSEPVKSLVLTLISGHVLQTLKGNPLSGSTSEAILVETANEISSQISGLVGGALRAFAAQGEVDVRSMKSVEAAVLKVLASPISKFSKMPNHQPHKLFTRS